MMLLRKITTLLFALLPIIVMAQKINTIRTGSIKGAIRDSLENYNMKMTSVSVFNSADSSLLQSQFTDSLGAFSFSNLPLNTSLLIAVTNIGYKEYIKNIRLDTVHQSIDLNVIKMIQADSMMENVVVRTLAPLKMNGDTLEINPDAFKLDSNATVEKLLKKVPGMVVWRDGEMTVNGKKIKRVYVDGRPFFGDPKTALKNIPKHALDKLQVYNEKDSVNNITNTSADSSLTMNIKLKANKRNGYFGDQSIGYGTDKKYQFNGNIATFNPKNQFTLTTATSNTNQAAGRARSYTAQAFYNHLFGKNMDFTKSKNLLANYNFNGNENQVDVNTISSTPLLSDTVLTTNNTSNNSNSNYNHGLITTYSSAIKNKTFSIQSYGNYNNSRSSSSSNSSVENNYLGTVSENATTNASNGTTQEISVNARFANLDSIRLKNFDINYLLNYNKRNNNTSLLSRFTSLVLPQENQNVNRLTQNDDNRFDNSMAFSYAGLSGLLFRNNKNININFTNRISINKTEQKATVSDYDSVTLGYRINNDLTNNNGNMQINDEPNISLSATFRKQSDNGSENSLNLAANINGTIMHEHNTSNLSYRNITRSNQFFMPQFTAAYNYRTKTNANFSSNLEFNRTFQLPGIDQLYAITDTTDVYNQSYGDPNLKTAHVNTYSFSLNYNGSYLKKNIFMCGINTMYTTQENSIVNRTDIAISGSRKIYPINLDGSNEFSTSANLGLSRRIKDNQLQLQYSIGFNTKHSPGYLDTAYIVSNNNSINNNISILLSLKDLLQADITQTISNNINRQSGREANTLSNSLYTTACNLTLNYPKGFSWINTVNYSHTKAATSTAINNMVWNANVAYKFLKNEKAEVKFSAFDLLRQNANIINSINGNSISTTVSSGLQQFFIISLSYFPRKFGI